MITAWVLERLKIPSGLGSYSIYNEYILSQQHNWLQNLEKKTTGVSSSIYYLAYLLTHIDLCDCDYSLNTKIPNVGPRELYRFRSIHFFTTVDHLVSTPDLLGEFIYSLTRFQGDKNCEFDLKKALTKLSMLEENGKITVSELLDERSVPHAKLLFLIGALSGMPNLKGFKKFKFISRT